MTDALSPFAPQTTASPPPPLRTTPRYPIPSVIETPPPPPGQLVGAFVLSYPRPLMGNRRSREVQGVVQIWLSRGTGP